MKAQAAQTGTAEELQAAKAREAAARAEAEVATRESMKHRGLLEIATAQADSLSLKHEVSAFDAKLSAGITNVFMSVRFP